MDDLLSMLKPKLSYGDIIIDGGNEYYQNAEKRMTDLRSLGVM